MANLTEIVKSRISDRFFTFNCAYEQITSSIDRFGISKPNEKTTYNFKCLQIPESKGNDAEFKFTVNGIETQTHGYLLINRIDLENVGLIVNDINKMKAGDYFVVAGQRYEVIGLPQVAPDIRDTDKFVLLKVFYRKEM